MPHQSSTISSRSDRALPKPEGDLVWYASYGSNMSAARFGVYLRGGQLPGRPRVYDGARDRTPPLADMPLMLDGQLYFAGASNVWGGGFGLLDPDAPGQIPGRAYLVTVEQFSDVVAQEMWRPPGVTLDVSAAVNAGRDTLGPGAYETLVCAGHSDGVPILTFTSEARRPVTAPSAAYLAMIGRGIIEAHAWTPTRVGSYLASRPGAEGHWTPVAITDLLA